VATGQGEIGPAVTAAVTVAGIAVIAESVAASIADAPKVPRK
jgi:hypothetical protein